MSAPALAAQAPSRRAFVLSDILSDTGRIFRPSVRRFAPALTAQFAALEDSGDIHETCGLINNASLLFALAGEETFAEDICRRQMEWLHACLPRGDAHEIASLAIQPWVNLGRLYRMRGEHARALAQFAQVFDTDGHGLLHYGCFAVRPKDVRYDDAELLYVVDSLRTYCSARGYEQGLRFIRRMHTRVQSIASRPRLDEYEFHLCLRRGFLKAAERVLERMSWHLQPHLKLINAFYRCVLLEAKGNDCSDVTRRLTQWAIGALSEEAAPDHYVFRYGLELARFLLRAGYRGSAALIEAGRSASARFEDVPIHFEFVRLESGMDAARAVLADADYTGFARRFGITLKRSSEADAALDELRVALRAVIG